MRTFQTHFRVVPAGLLVLSLAVLAACAGAGVGSAVRPAGSKSVKVKVKCNPGKFEVSVRPFTVTIKRGESVFWEPERSWGSVDRNDAVVEIQPKTPGNWPFTAPPPQLPVDGGVASGTLTATGPDTISYNLRFSCTIDGMTRIFEIDPDIIVDWT